MVAVDPRAAFYDIASPTKPISTKFEDDTADEVSSHQPKYHCNRLDFRGGLGPHVMRARAIIGTKTHKNTTK